MECRVGEGTMVCTGSGTGDENCEVLKTPSIGGVNATSFSFFIIGMSCLSQLVAFIFLGRSGDYGDNRKTYLLWSSMVGATALIMFVFFPVGEAYPKHIFAALLTIVSNTAFGLAQIYYNAYLPLLTEDMAEREKGRVAAADSLEERRVAGETATSTLDGAENILNSERIAPTGTLSQNGYRNGNNLNSCSKTVKHTLCAGADSRADPAGGKHGPFRLMARGSR